MFNYDIFPQSADHLKDLGVKLHYRTTWWDVLEVAEEYKTFDAATLKEVRAFLTEPSKWSAAHGAIATFKASA